MRLLIDMNLTPRRVQFLRNAEYDSVHWSSVGAISAKDGDIFDYARRYAYVLLTNDLDFPQMLAHTRQAAPSVVLLRGEPLTPEARGLALLRALKDCETEPNQGAIVTLDWSDKPRARVLPLG
jgi:predicted nuclease of predicted toxin-antitoxin system